MTLKSSFAVVLRALRSKRNISQRDFSDTTSRTYLSKLEGGKSSVTLDKLEQLSERLELTALALLALTVSEDTGEPASLLVAKLGEEILTLEREGGLPGLSTLEPAASLSPALPKSPRAAANPASRPALARMVGQCELPF
ncbi:helix-turn-helix domain-containing protein [Pseudomonas urethralis]|uniref:helix-turn-helix domain-containing protein n=1 Tax=Pseudomonas urethralis TaxID=2740517 RepID=UPI0015968C2E|nr:helix-turn-helix transcriptional regulator [Pseudomonas urethralis]